MILNQGIVTVKDHNKKIMEDYIMRLIMPNEISQVTDLQEYVYDNLPNKQVLVTDTREEILEDMDFGAKIIGVFNPKGQLISYRYFSFPNQREKNMGKYIGLHEEEFSSVVHLETTMVHPKYRGNDLQNLTLQEAFKISQRDGYHHFICTVSPFNFYSLYNIMKNGLQIKGLRKMYHQGYLRFILHKDINQSICLNPSDIIRSKFDNVGFNKILINNGYIGSMINKENQNIAFMRPIGCDSLVA